MTLWPQVEQVKAPDVCRNACVLGHIAKNSHTTAFGEFAILIVQIFYREKKEGKVRNSIRVPLLKKGNAIGQLLVLRNPTRPEARNEK